MRWGAESESKSNLDLLKKENEMGEVSGVSPDSDNVGNEQANLLRSWPAEYQAKARWLMEEMSVVDFEKVEKKNDLNKIVRPSLSYWQDAWIRLKKNKQAFLSMVIICALLVFTLIGPVLWDRDPAAQDLTRISEPPSLSKPSVVLSELDLYEPIIDESIPEFPAEEVAGSDLAASKKIRWIAPPSIYGVRLNWDSVVGASGYRVYRSLDKPTDNYSLGVPLGDVQGGNRLSFQDQFDLAPGTFYYSVVAINGMGEESPQLISIKADLPKGVTLDEAQKINPDVKPGESVIMPGYPLGTDYLGRDLLSRLMEGARVSLFIGIFAPLLSTLLGVLIGGLAGYLGGKVDSILMRFTDFVLALPFLLFMILFKVMMGAQPGESGVSAMLVALVALSWTGPARLTRGQVLQLRESEFVHAAKLMGAKSFYILWRHLLPNTLGVILVSLTFSIPTAIFTEAFLSFIGMGVVPPTPSWGSMCNDGIQRFLTYPHEFLFPAIMISVAVLAFNLFGDGLRDALDPKLRSR